MVVQARLAEVMQVLFDDDQRAVGIEYIDNCFDRSSIMHARKEVILSAGAIDSPKLLMLSGIGPADHLKSVGIKPLHDLPGVGGNLQDHLDAMVLNYCKTSGVTYDRSNKLWSLYRYWKDKKGPGTSPIAETGGFLSTRSGLAAPDIQLHFLPVMVVDHGRTRLGKDGYSLHVCALRPESKGTIRLASTDPRAAPLIDANYLAERKDLDTLVAGVKMGREIFAQSGLDPYRAGEYAPGAAVKTDAEIEQWVRAKSETIYHPVGTCKMGEDPRAVVDSRLKVRGLEGLRVIDAGQMIAAPLCCTLLADFDKLVREKPAAKTAADLANSDVVAWEARMGQFQRALLFGREQGDRRPYRAGFVPERRAFVTAGLQAPGEITEVLGHGFRQQFGPPPAHPHAIDHKVHGEGLNNEFCEVFGAVCGATCGDDEVRLIERV